MEVWGRDQQNLALGLENTLRTDNKGTRSHQRKEGRDGGSREDTKGQLYGAIWPHLVVVMVVVMMVMTRAIKVAAATA